MSIQNQKTTADYLEWNSALILLQKLEQDGEHLFAMLLCVGMNTGLRFSDILTLRWTDLTDAETVNLLEKKTKKATEIKINSNLKEFSKKIFEKLHLPDGNALIFLNKKGQKVISIQYINRRLKEIKITYKLKIKNISTHTFRKTFGRHVWEIHNQSERALILLSELFNHSNISVTKRYLGIRHEELMEVYDLL